MQKRKSAISLEKLDLDQTPVLIDCPQCHSFISTADINQNNKIAKCSHCNHIFSYDDQDYWDPFGLPTATQPAGLEVLRLPNFMEIKIQHFQTSNQNFWSLLFFTIIWNIFLLVFVFAGISSGEYMVLAFTSVHLMVGLGLIFNVFSKLFNYTRVYIDDKQLCINTGPLNFFKKSQCFDVADIKQLFVRTTEHRNSKGHKVINHALLTQNEDGTSTLLINNLDQKTLYYLEKEIERYLKIVDRPVTD